MAAAVVEFKLDEIGSLAKKLNAFALSPEQRQGLLESLGTEIIEQTHDRFESETDPDGNKWKALNPIYAAGKNAGSILRREGFLLQSMTSEVQNDYSILVGATMEYAAIHQFGGEIKPKSAKALFVPGFGFVKKVTIPARPYLGLSSGNIKDLEAEVDRFLGGLSP
jgi:phage virion morphogenesis protein